MAQKSAGYVGAQKSAGYVGVVAAVRGFNRFYTRLLGLLDEKLLASPVSLTEARILWELERNPHSRAEDLLERLSVDRGYMSRILSRLERAGLLSRTAHARDGRMLLLDLTPQGHAFLSGLEEKASVQIAGLLEPLAPAQRKRLVQAMAEVEALLSAPRESTALNGGSLRNEIPLNTGPASLGDMRAAAARHRGHLKEVLLCCAVPSLRPDRGGGPKCLQSSKAHSGTASKGRKSITSRRT